jgi:hypothetical protein
VLVKGDSLDEKFEEPLKFERINNEDPLLMEFKIYFQTPNKISTQQDPDYIWLRAI